MRPLNERFFAGFMSEFATHAAIEAVARDSYGRLVAYIASRTGDIADSAAKREVADRLCEWFGGSPATLLTSATLPTRAARKCFSPSGCAFGVCWERRILTFATFARSEGMKIVRILCRAALVMMQ